MGIRQSLQSNPKLGMVVAAVATLVAVTFIYSEVRSMGDGSDQNQLYYSVDDGKSYFADSMTRMPPFAKGGAMAVQAHVFKINGKPTVVYLSRYTQTMLDAIKEAAEAHAANRPPAKPQLLAQMGNAGVEVKKPGDPDWILLSDPRSFRITRGGATQAEMAPGN